VTAHQAAHLVILMMIPIILNLEIKDKEDVNNLEIQEINLEILKRTIKTLVHQTLAHHLIVILMTTQAQEEIQETLERVTRNQEILLENQDNLENQGNQENLKNLNLRDQDLKNQDLTLTNLETRKAIHLVNLEDKGTLKNLEGPETLEKIKLEDKILEILQGLTHQGDLILQEDQTLQETQTNLETNLDLTDQETSLDLTNLETSLGLTDLETNLEETGQETLTDQEAKTRNQEIL